MATDPYNGLWAPYSIDNKDTSSGSTVEVSRNTNSSLDKDAFLKLLVTQMQYQDPLNPVDDKQFLSQMAQFTSLEQMQNMNLTSSKSQAYSMIGKEVYAETYNSETYKFEQIEGYVAAVTMKNGKPYLMVMNDKSEDPIEVSLDDVKEVYDTNAYSTASQMQGIYDSMSVSQNMALVGKYIQAITVDANGDPIFVEGQVDYVKFYNNQALLVVGDKEIYGKEVTSVADKKLLLEEKVSVNRKNEVTEEYEEYVKNGVISDVKFKDDNVYLVVDGKEVKIDNISYVTEAIRYVGKDLTSGTVKGKITDVIIQDGKTYLQVKTSGENEEAEYGLVEFSKVRGKL